MCAQMIQGNTLKCRNTLSKISLYSNREVTVSIAGLVDEILIHFCPAQWSRGLRSQCAVARLLGLRVRIPPGGMCCQIEVSATG